MSFNGFGPFLKKGSKKKAFEQLVEFSDHQNFGVVARDCPISLLVIGLFLFPDLISFFLVNVPKLRRRRKSTRLRKIREFTNSHQQRKQELIQDIQEEQGEMAAANNRTLKELATPDLDQQPLCIQYPNLEVAFELKFGLIHLLITFHGFAGEDPNKHLKEFHVVCSSMRPTGVTEEQIKLKAFPFSLANSAKE